MKLIWERDGKQTELSVPGRGETTAKTGELCRYCGESLRLHGTHQSRGHDNFVSDAKCIECGGDYGKLILFVDTLFGLAEDEAVLYGRCRVY